MPTFDGKNENFELFEDLRASKAIVNCLKRTESTTSILSLGETPNKLLNTLIALPERVWEIFWQFFEGNTKNPNRWRQRNTNSKNLSSTQKIKS